MKYLSFLFCLLILSCVCSRKSYRLTIESFEFCKDTDLPFADPLPYDLQVEIFNSSKGYNLIRANVTFEKDLMARQYKGTFSAGEKMSSGVKWFIKINDFNCNSFVIKAILRGFGVPMKGCVIKKGVYITKEVDVDAIDNDFFATGAPSRIYGNYVVKVVLYGKTKSIACWNLDIAASPLKKQRG